MGELVLDLRDRPNPFPPTTGEWVHTSEFIEHSSPNPHEAESTGVVGGAVESQGRVDQSFTTSRGEIIAVNVSRKSGGDSRKCPINQVEEIDGVGRWEGWAEGVWCYHGETPAGG